MCGILAVLHAEGTPEQVRRRLLAASRLLRHRGPDSSACWQSVHGGDAIAFERLQIIDPSASGGCVFFVFFCFCFFLWRL
jgi:asparagine synthetase B (glutamine-hydrolysing)